MAEIFIDGDPGPEIRRKLNEMWADWLQALEEAVGPQGWSPAFGVVADGGRRVLQIVDWVGGAGEKPSITGYIGASGIVPSIEDAIDIRGAQGVQGIKGDQGDKGDKGDTGDTGPQGNTGPANSLSIGTVQDGPTADATITGTAPSQTLNLTLPKGDTGSTGPKGDKGDQGDVGPKGDKGDQGDVGPKGDKGDQGDQGPKGDKGDTGDTGPKGDTGNAAWTPVYAAVADGERRVLRIDDWTGGQGTKPATGYLGVSGIVAAIGDALDIRGAPGEGAVSSVNTVEPDGAGNVELGIGDIPGLEDALDDAGQVKTVAGVSPDGAGNVALGKSDVGLDNVDNTSDMDKPIPTSVANALGGKLDASEKGAANGVAPLDSSGHVPAVNLPSYVDDVLEFASLSALPTPGEAGKIYVTLDTNKTYRWGGSSYAEISASPGSTDAVPEGASNLYFTVARVRATVLAGLSLATSSAITAADTVLSAFGKLQKQLSDLIGSLSTVATSGSYNDLSNRPSIPAAQVNSDWSASSGVAQILNKPSAMSQGEAETGTATTPRLLTAQVLKAAIDEHGGGGGVSGEAVITTSQSWPVPSGATWVYVELIGGGGSGHARVITSAAGGSGGGGGGFANGLFLAHTLGGSISCVVGAGGAAAVAIDTDNVNGNDGGDTMFGSLLIAPGGGAGSSTGGGNGGGGEVAPANAAIASGGGYSSGAGSTSRAGNINVLAAGNSVMGGAGGGCGGTSGSVSVDGGVSAHAGNGGAGLRTTTSGQTAGNGQFPGGGGGGAVLNAASGTITSGKGGDGRIRIYWW